MPLCILLQKLSQVQTAVDTERAFCEQTHQRCLLEESCLSHLQEQLDRAEQQAHEDLREVILIFISRMHLGNVQFSDMLRGPNLLFI